LPTQSFTSKAAAAYAEHVNPQWVKLLDLLEMNVSYERCQGAELFAADGRVVAEVHSSGAFWTEALGLVGRVANI